MQESELTWGARGQSVAAILGSRIRRKMQDLRGPPWPWRPPAHPQREGPVLTPIQWHEVTPLTFRVLEVCRVDR